MELTSARLLDALRRLPTAPCYRVALSGGLDSTVLLHALVGTRQRDAPAFELSAIHVHHGLHGQADAWVAHCESLCAGLRVPCRVLRVDARPAPGESPEAAARRARYAALAESLGPGEGLLTAHHQDDQAETLLLQLLRGAGPRGLAGMPPWARFAGGWLGRPLLGWRRAELQDYAERHGLAWIDDPSNTDTGLARNFLRHDILPRLEQRWPAAAHTLARAAAHQAEAAALLAERAEADMAGALTPEGALSIEALGALGVARQRNLLRHWLHTRGVALPDTVHLQRILAEVVAARPDAVPRVAWGEAGAEGARVEVRRYRGRLHVLQPAAVRAGQGPLPWASDAIADHPLALPELEACLVARPIHGAGLSAAACRGRTITVRFRGGGEVCRPAGRGGHGHALKKLFQEWGVPPWERARVPLLYIGDELAQVVGHCVCEPFAAHRDEPGWAIGIERAARAGAMPADVDSAASND